VKPCLRIEGRAGNLVRYADQLAQHTAVANDLGIAANVRRRRRVLRERIQVGQAADFLALASRDQRFIDRDHIGRLGRADQLDDVLEDDPMVKAVKVIRTDEVGNAIVSRIVEQQAAQHGLLRFDGMRGHAQGVELRVGPIVHGGGLYPLPEGTNYGFANR